MNTAKSVRFSSEDGALAAATLTVTNIDHPDPTNPSYKLQPDTTSTKLVLTRPNLRAGGAGYAAEKLPMEPQGYPVFQGLHFCGGGLAADFQLILSEIPPPEPAAGDAVGADGGEASETAAAAAAAGPVPWVDDVDRAQGCAFAAMAKARDVAAAVNAACSNAEYAEMEALRKSRADAAADAAASLAALKVVGEGSGLKAIAKENAEKEAAATAVASSPAEE